MESRTSLRGNSQSPKITPFDLADQNWDGIVDTSELAEVMNINDDTARSIVKEYDTNDDGVLDENEYKKLEMEISNAKITTSNALLAVMENGSTSHDEIASFNVADRNKDGNVDTDELAKVMSINNDSARSIVDEYDANNDGVLDVKEYKKFKLSKESKQELEWIRYYDKNYKGFIS